MQLIHEKLTRLWRLNNHLKQYFIALCWTLLSIVLHWIAVHYTVLNSTALHFNTWYWDKMYCCVLQFNAVYCSVLQCTKMCSALQYPDLATSQPEAAIQPHPILQHCSHWGITLERQSWRNSLIVTDNLATFHLAPMATKISGKRIKGQQATRLKIMCYRCHISRFFCFSFFWTKCWS